jgi:hypothetical protein
MLPGFLLVLLEFFLGVPAPPGRGLQRLAGGRPAVSLALNSFPLSPGMFGFDLCGGLRLGRIRCLRF